MSMVSSQLGRRLIESHESYAGVRGTLADLPSGARAQIVDVRDTDSATARRLFDLGFAPGAEVEMLRKAPLADPVVFRIAGYDIALRRVQARCIQVTAPASTSE